MVGKSFFGKSPVDSADILWVKHFVENALSCTVSEILKTFILSVKKNRGVQFIVNKSAIFY